MVSNTGELRSRWARGPHAPPAVTQQTDCQPTPPPRWWRRLTSVNNSTHSGLEAPAIRRRWRFIMRTQNHGVPVDCSDGIALFERKSELSQLACRGQSQGKNDILRGVLLDHETGRSAAVARRKAGATCQASLTTSPSNPLNHHTHPRGDQRVPGSPGTRCRHGNTSLAKWLA